MNLRRYFWGALAGAVLSIPANAIGWFCYNLVPLCANVLETPTPIEFSVEGGEAEEHGVPEGVGLRG